jgi:hypothetical protein
MYAMNSVPSECTACALVIHDPSASVYTQVGNLVCLACGIQAKDADGKASAVEDGRERIGGLGGAIAALVALALFVYATHDQHWVYVERGHVQETSDASLSVLASGLGFSLFAGFGGFFLAWWLAGRRKSG